MSGARAGARHHERPFPALPAEVALDRVPELLGEIERLRAVLWARLTRDATTTTARYDRRGDHAKRRAAGLLVVPYVRGV